MKKYTIICASLFLAVAFTSCGSSEKAYRKMYEKAQAAENKTATEQPTEEVAVVTPVVEKPANETVVVDNTDNVPVRQGKYSVISGAGLQFVMLHEPLSLPYQGLAAENNYPYKHLPCQPWQ